MSHTMKNRKTLVEARLTVASHPRRWRKPVPCPICGGKDIRFHTFGKGLDRIDLLGPPYWFVTCTRCNRAVVIDTNYTDPKEVVRAWNYLATDYKKD